MSEAYLPDQVSDVIEPDKILSLVRALPSVLTNLVGDSLLIVRYGAGCDIHGDLWLVPMRVKTSWLSRFLDSTIERKIFRAGESELRIEIENGSLSVNFCNEGHLHVAGGDLQLRSAFLSVSPFSTVTMVGWSDNF